MCVSAEVLLGGRVIRVIGYVDDYFVVATFLGNINASLTCTFAFRGQPDLLQLCTLIDGRNTSSECAAVLYVFNATSNFLPLGCFNQTGQNTNLDDQNLRWLRREKEALESLKGVIKQFCF